MRSSTPPGKSACERAFRALAALLLFFLGLSSEPCLAGGVTSQGKPTSLLLQAWREGAQIVALAANTSKTEARLILGAGRSGKGFQSLGEAPIFISPKAILRTTIPCEIDGARVEALFLRQDGAGSFTAICNVIGIHPDSAGWSAQKLAFASGESVSFQLNAPAEQEGFWIFRQDAAGGGVKFHLEASELPPRVAQIAGPERSRSPAPGSLPEILVQTLRSEDRAFKLTRGEDAQIVFSLSDVSVPECALLQFSVLKFQPRGKGLVSGGMSGPRLLVYNPSVMRLENRSIRFSPAKQQLLLSSVDSPGATVAKQSHKEPTPLPSRLGSQRSFCCRQRDFQLNTDTQ